MRLFSFRFLFCVLAFTFLLGEPGQRFVTLVYPFEEPALGFVDFFPLFFNLYFIYLLTLGFVLLSVVALGVHLDRLRFFLIS